MVSPLKLDIGTTKVLREVTKNKIPVALSTAPVAGSTAPATLAGILAQVHAEELFGIVLSQMFSEEAPVLYGPVPGAANMQNMSYLGGACETGLMNAACVQLARHIDIPIYSDAGLTDSKLSDIQAGIEKAFNILQVALAGGNYIHHAAGMLESMLTAAYEQFVIDNDIIGMALRTLEGIKVEEDRLALEVINKVGPGGNFLTQPHTVKYARSDEYYLPKTADRKGRNAWEEAGSLDAREKAKELAKEILKKPTENLIPEEIDKKIREKFDIKLPRE
jgi:trimethylamine--corrinoid protein Co-methyltransferase